MLPVALQGLKVTRGSVEGSQALRLSTPTIRAVAPSTGSAAQLRFTYRGPTESTRALASGAERRQVGLKLRARNGCNLVYVMWRVEPEPGIVVSVKHNPGMAFHFQCGAKGYKNVARVDAVPSVLDGRPHALGASLSGSWLRVYAEGSLVWEGDLGPEVLTFDGPTGFRSDNGVFDVELEASPAGNLPFELETDGD
jgi:hypothetical protein